jgi:large subunit ribosomal protein L18
MMKKLKSGFIRRQKRVREAVKEGRRKRKICVFRSDRFIYAQIVDLITGKTLVTVSTREIDRKGNKVTKTEAAFLAGEKLAKKALKLGIRKVVFDRSGYKYHGRVKALAEGARQGGLKF